jgi:hypothetical protein
MADRGDHLVGQRGTTPTLREKWGGNVTLHVHCGSAANALELSPEAASATLTPRGGGARVGARAKVAGCAVSEGP